MTFRTLSDETITLRAPEPSDLDLLYLWENDEKNWEVSLTIAPFSRATLQEYLNNATRSIFETGQMRLMIELKQGECVGCIDIFDFDPLNSRAGVGILIHDAHHRNKGVGRQALELVIDYCFNRLNLHQLFANVNTSNSASIHLFEKCGFVKAGLKKEWNFTPSGWSDELIFQRINDR